MPEEQIKPRSKIEHFSDLADQAIEQGLRFKLVGCDSFYGRDQSLLGSITDNTLIFVADIPSDTQVWIKKRQGEQRPRSMGSSGATRVGQLKALPMSQIKVRDGESGPIVVQAYSREGVDLVCDTGGTTELHAVGQRARQRQAQSDADQRASRHRIREC